MLIRQLANVLEKFALNPPNTELKPAAVAVNLTSAQILATFCALPENQKPDVKATPKRLSDFLKFKNLPTPELSFVGDLKKVDEIANKVGRFPLPFSINLPKPFNESSSFFNITSFCDSQSISTLAVCSRSLLFKTPGRLQRQFVEELQIHPELVKTIMIDVILNQDLKRLYQNIKRFIAFTNTTYQFNKLWEVQLLSGNLEAMHAGLTSALGSVSSDLPSAENKEVKRSIGNGKENRYYFHPFHLLCAGGSVKCIKEAVGRFRDTFFDVNNMDTSRLTVFHYACIGESKASLLYLLDEICSGQKSGVRYVNWAKQTESLMNIFHAACLAGNIEVIQMLVKKEFSQIVSDVRSITQNGDNYLHLACRSGSSAMVEIVLENWPDEIVMGIVNDLNNEGYTPFQYACMYGTPKMLDRLYKRNDVNILGETHYTKGALSALHLACLYGRPETIGYLLTLKDSNDAYLFDPLRKNNKGKGNFNSFYFAEQRLQYVSEQIKNILLQHQESNSLVQVKESTGRCLIM